MVVLTEQIVVKSKHHVDGTTIHGESFSLFKFVQSLMCMLRQNQTLHELEK